MGVRAKRRAELPACFIFVFVVRGERAARRAAPQRRGLPLIWSEIITLSQKILATPVAVGRCASLLIRTPQQQPQVGDEIWK